MKRKYYKPMRHNHVIAIDKKGTRYNISVRRDVPYITYERNTRVLYVSDTGFPYINLHGTKVKFVEDWR